MDMKKLSLFLLILALICVPMSVSTQAESSLIAALERLSDEDLIALMEAVTAEVEARGLLTQEKAYKAPTGDIYVWVPKSGSKYHDTSSCSNMTSPSQVTLEMAVELGYTPCKKCKPPV